MRTLPKKYLSQIPIEDDVYKPDLIVLEKYQSFSAELLRLALLSLAGYGFLLVNIVFKVSAEDKYIFYPLFYENRLIIGAGVFSLGFAAITALMHRFYSTDCLAHHIRSLRLRHQKQMKISEPGDTSADSLDSIIETESESLHKDLRKSKWLLILSNGFLLIGILLIALVFSTLLFSGMPTN